MLVTRQLEDNSTFQRCRSDQPCTCCRGCSELYALFCCTIFCLIQLILVPRAAVSSSDRAWWISFVSGLLHFTYGHCGRIEKGKSYLCIFLQMTFACTFGSAVARLRQQTEIQYNDCLRMIMHGYTVHAQFAGHVIWQRKYNIFFGLWALATFAAHDFDAIRRARFSCRVSCDIDKYSLATTATAGGHAKISRE